MRTAYFILGMHRSGTSALASTLNGLGIPLGESLLEASDDNPKGYFENKAVQEFNETLLVSKGHGWDDVFFDIADISELDYQRLVTSAARILEKEFSCFSNFAIKDPRMCILLPIWLDACRQLDITPKVILAHRNPLEIAQSLKKRNGIDVNNALSLWADHMFKAEKYSRDIARVLISYEDLLNDFDKVSRTFSEFTGGMTSSGLKQASVIDKSLRHHKRSGEKLENVPDCLSVLLQQYNDGALSAKALDNAMREFNSLKGFFFNANRTALFHQVFEERRKYKDLKDDYFEKLQSSSDKVKKYHDELAKAKEELSKQKADKQNFTESIQQRDERIRSETEKKNDLNRELNQLLGKLQKLELSEQYKEQQLNKINAELVSLSNDKQKLEAIRNEYEKLQLSSQQKQQKVEALQNDNAILTDRVKEFKESVEKRDERIRAELDKNKSLEKDNAKLSHELRKSEIDQKQQQHTIEALTNTKNAALSSIKELEQKLEQANTKLNELNELFREQKLKLEKLQVSNDTLTSDIQQKDIELEKLHISNDTLTSDIQQKDIELEKSQRNVTELQALNDALIGDIQQQDAAIEKSHSEKKQLSHTIASLEKAIKETQAKADSVAAQAQLSEQQKATEIKRLQNKLNDCLEINNDLKARIVELEKQNELGQSTLQRKLDSVNTTLNEWVDLIVAPLSSLASDYEQSKQKHSRLTAGFKTAVLSGRLDNALQRLNKNIDAARNIPPAFISNFDEQGYYTCNEDVEVAVESGEFRSGLDHFLKFGYEETLQGKRKLHPKGTLFNPENKNADELPSLFNTFLATFYDEIAKRQELVKEAAKEISNNGQDKEAQAKQTKPTEITKGLMRPAPNHINALKNVPSVDIILPVYNALDDVKACIESLYNNETVPFNLIIIDDCSEEETKVWLESAQKQYGFNLSRNTENLRFTKTVNKGFKQSSGDFVVLLNSDTIVTAYWLEKILCCFESDESVGIVGPLSNAASWQTVPEREDKVNGGWLVNEIPAGYSIELMGQLVETISQRQYPNVPSVNGFCYVIKRNVIDTIGTLDEEYFPTGYGEEDDFSIRARKAGFAIRVADDTYIFHAKSKSYTKEVRKVLTVGGRKSLDKKHGKEEIERLIAAWKAEPLLPEIGKDIKSFMHESSGNSKVVFTAIFGNYDNLKTPEYINPDWDYVCFTDNKKLESDVFTIKHVNQRFENTTKNARMIKLLSHLFLINYDYSLWIDGSVKLRGKNINELITNNLADDYISLHNHVKRDCVYEEADACMLAKKDGTDILAKQIAHYRNEGFPEAAGVFETAEIIRRQYATDVEMLNSLWWQQLDKFSIRDQVALPYVFWKHKFKSFQMEGNQWLDPYFHMYKHRSAQTRNTTAVEILVNVTSAEANIEGVVKNIFDKTNYQNFNVTVLLGSSASIPNEAKASLQQTYADKLSFHNNEKANTPADLNSYIKRGKTKLCCLITEDTAFFNSDWLDVLVDGLNQDTKATFAGPTILSENFDFIASSVRVKRKQGQLKEIFNARKLGGTGAVLAIHQACILFERQQFVRLGGFSNAFTKLRSAAIELFHRNNEDKKHTLLVGNSEVIVNNDCEEIEMEQLTKLL